MKENIKEDMKVVEKLIRTMEQDRITFKDEQSKEIYAFFIKSLQHILSDYKRVLKENEELKETNKVISIELTKDKVLQQNCLRTVCGVPIGEIPKIIKENEELKNRWDKDTHKLQNDLDIANAKRIDWEKAYQEEKDKQFELLRANQKLQEVNEELKVERDGIYEDYQDLGKEKWSADEAILFITERLENSIPKQKIKDKIEEYLDYDKEHKTYTKDGRENFTTEYFKAKTLQELLEEKGE